MSHSQPAHKTVASRGRQRHTCANKKEIIGDREHREMEPGSLKSRQKGREREGGGAVKTESQ